MHKYAGVKSRNSLKGTKWHHAVLETYLSASARLSYTFRCRGIAVICKYIQWRCGTKILSASTTQHWCCDKDVGAPAKASKSKRASKCIAQHTRSNSYNDGKMWQRSTFNRKIASSKKSDLKIGSLGLTYLDEENWRMAPWRAIGIKNKSFYIFCDDCGFIYQLTCANRTEL